jgi:hypothetical protein
LPDFSFDGLPTPLPRNVGRSPKTQNAFHSRQAVGTYIPLHLALIKTGLLKFVATMKSGPLFALLSPDAPAERAGA